MQLHEIEHGFIFTPEKEDLQKWYEPRGAP